MVDETVDFTILVKEGRVDIIFILTVYFAF